MRMKSEPKAPAVSPPTDNETRRRSLSQSASATDALRAAFAKHTTSRQDPGRDRTS
jgi:hypothetical protein